MNQNNYQIDNSYHLNCSLDNLLEQIRSDF